MDVDVTDNTLEESFFESKNFCASAIETVFIKEELDVPSVGVCTQPDAIIGIKLEEEVVDVKTELDWNEALNPDLIKQDKDGSASGEAAGGADGCEVCSTKQHIWLGCSQCGLVPAGAGQLQQHIDLEHPASGPANCSKYTSSSGSVLPKKKKDYTRKSLQEQINSNYLRRIKHQCKFCLISCATDADLEQHILLLHPQKKKGKKPMGKYMGGCKKILQKHCPPKRSSMKKFCCSKCDYACTRKRQLDSHCLYKHSTKKPFQCSKCNYACTTKLNLEHHILCKHSTKKPFQCSKCDYACTTKINLEYHFLSKHSTSKPFKCFECGYTSNKKKPLRSHIYFKHFVKPIQCPECDYSFITKQVLKRHFLLQHSTEKAH
ncbi:gastrula zinc finger protein XlCGF46.1-like [Hyalella azteca]|uniref:Gastrula zinc finger protein XlCGF46.1-like n=1 Tax=Hyalella azteca TaxID=294128 RepID=A0A8B7NUH8_HYAAZ|nr:gastrula zinc finger protein XlCGF46.1-like [Hyalella azteca]